MRFWIEDRSAGFEKTDIAIEKSVRSVFDLFDKLFSANIIRTDTKRQKTPVIKYFILKNFLSTKNTNIKYITNVFIKFARSPIIKDKISMIKIRR